MHIHAKRSFTHTYSNMPIMAPGDTATHLLVVLDLVLCDDAVGLLGLVPGELDAALLHALPHDLADLRRGCWNNTEASARVSIEAQLIQPQLTVSQTADSQLDQSAPYRASQPGPLP